jgi:hypothetical protein
MSCIVDGKNMSKHDNISSFVNWGNENLPIKSKLTFGVLLVATLSFFFSIAVDERPMLSIGSVLGFTVVYILLEVHVHRRLKTNVASRWFLLPINIASAFVGICCLHITEEILLSLSAPTFILLGAPLIALLAFMITNAFRILDVKRGIYAEKQKKKMMIDASVLKFPVIFGSVSGVSVLFFMPFLQKELGVEGLDSTLPIFVLISACFFICLPPHFLKFYYATKYDIEVIPTWLDKYETVPFVKFRYASDDGVGYYVVVKEKRKPNRHYIIELFPYNNRGKGAALTVETNSFDKDAFHIDMVVTVNGLVCYELNGAPFGKLSDGKFVDFRKMKLEGAPNLEIVMIGEALVQENIRWFDDFGEYLVKSGSPIGMEIAKRYQDNNFTETELWQIEEHALNAEDITKWANEIRNTLDSNGFPPANEYYEG